MQAVRTGRATLHGMDVLGWLSWLGRVGREGGGGGGGGGGLGGAAPPLDALALFGASRTYAALVTPPDSFLRSAANSLGKLCPATLEAAFTIVTQSDIHRHVVHSRSLRNGWMIVPSHNLAGTFKAGGPDLQHGMSDHRTHTHACYCLPLSPPLPPPPLLADASKALGTIFSLGRAECILRYCTSGEPAANLLFSPFESKAACTAGQSSYNNNKVGSAHNLFSLCPTP